jgi:hypothetical protein
MSVSQGFPKENRAFAPRSPTVSGSWDRITARVECTSILINFSFLLLLFQAIKLHVQLHVQLFGEPVKVPNHLLELFIGIGAGDVGRIDLDHASSLPFSNVLVME